MVFLFTAGQLGNQIFQYEFVKKLGYKEKIVTSKCEYFNIVEYDKKEYFFVNKYTRFILRRVLKYFVNIELITYIKQDQYFINGYEIENDTYSEKKGLLKSIKLIEGFYQSNKFVNNDVQIKKELIIKAKEFLSPIPINSQKIFVHIRRGDYLDWTILGNKNPSLPLSYYKESIHWFIENYNNPYFIFLSNDYKFVEKEFSYIENKIISRNNVSIDFTLMLLCENAIISNSTLSWWGVFLMKKKKNIFAPNYWLGWQSEVWFPKGIELDFVNYKNILEKESNDV